MDRKAEADFSALYERTSPHVWRTLGRAGVLRKAERAELAQDVYVVAHQKRATRNPKVPELAWICAIAWNVAQRHRALARTQREQPVDEPEIVDDAASSGPSPEDAVTRRSRYLRLMQGLRFERRTAFEMYEVDGFTIDEIAGALGVPKGTAITWLRAARMELAAAASRMDAREARAEGRAGALPLLLPFGVGAWRPMAALFDDAPPAMQEQVWRGVRRAVDRASVVSAVAGAAAGKAAAGTLLGAGFALGGATLGGMLYLLHLLGAPSAQPSIVRAPDVTPVAVASAEAPAASTASSAAGAVPAATGATPTATGAAAPFPPQVAPGGIDPEEERLLERAQAAYARGNREAAKAALAEHARRFPPGRAKLGAESDRSTKREGDSRRSRHRDGRVRAAPCAARTGRRKVVAGYANGPPTPRTGGNRDLQPVDHPAPRRGRDPHDPPAGIPRSGVVHHGRRARRDDARRVGRALRLDGALSALAALRDRSFREPPARCARRRDRRLRERYAGNDATLGGQGPYHVADREPGVPGPHASRRPPRF